MIRSNDVRFAPEIVGKLMALFPDKSNERINVEREQRVLRNETRSIIDLQPENVTNEQSDVDNSSGSQSSETPPSVSPSPPRRQLRNRATVKAPERLVEMTIIETDEPKSYQEAIQSEEKDVWKRAMEDENNSLAENFTWKLVQLPEKRKSISNRWLFKKKRNAEGEVIRYKARLVLR